MSANSIAPVVVMQSEMGSAGAGGPKKKNACMGHTDAGAGANVEDPAKLVLLNGTQKQVVVQCLDHHGVGQVEAVHLGLFGGANGQVPKLYTARFCLLHRHWAWRKLQASSAHGGQLRAG